MKIAVCGDQHWTVSKPANRIDDYYATVLRKLDWEVSTAIDMGCNVMVFPGDLFDHYKVPYGLVSKVLKTLVMAPSYHDMQFFCIAGQHDQRYHTQDLENTPLGLMVNAIDDLFLLGSKPTTYLSANNERTHFYGAGWGQEIPKPVDDTFNVLVTHRMVIGDTKLWEGQEDYTEAKGLLRDYPEYDLFITGDNHARVIQRDQHGRAVINMGSMMRSTTAQMEHVPAMAIFDTETKDLQILEIPCEPAHKVFAVEKVAVEKERNEKLDLFVNSLQQGEGAEKMNFASNLASFITKNRDTISAGVETELKRMLPTDTKLEV